MDEYTQGGSIDRTVNINDNGTPRDTDDLLTISVKVSNIHNNDDGGTYDLAGGDLVKLDPTTEGNVFFDIPPATSATMTPGLYYLQVTTTENDISYDGGVRTRRVIGPSFILLESV